MKSKHLIIVALIGFLTVAIAQVLTAYRADKQQYYNRDAAQNATDLISTLSCILNQTGADQETATSSSYAVWVDENRCRAGSVGSSDAGVQFSKYWVQQELVDGVLKVRWWEYGDSINGERPTYASAEISKGAVEGSANPYGVWSVNWCVSHLAADLADKTGDEACHQKGHAYISETNEYGLFYKRVPSGNSTAYEKLTTGAVGQDLASGFGKFRETVGDGANAVVRQGSFGFADGALKQTYNGANVCKSPVANSPDSLHQIWDGWLYNIDTQARVESATGPFAVKRVSDGAVGWASHEGVRLPGSSMAESDGKFVRVEGSDKTELDAFTTAGVLIKRTPNLLVNGLQDIDNLKLRFKVKRDAFLTSLFSDADTTPASPQTDQYVVGYWNQTESKFIFTGYDISATGLTGKYFKEYSTPFKFSVAELVLEMQGTGRDWERSLWTFLMGSNQEYYLQLADSVGNPEPSDTRPALAKPLVYRLDQIRVIPGSADAPKEELICIGKCPRPGAGSNGEKLVLDLNKSSWTKAEFDALPTYTFDASGNLAVGGISVDYRDIDRNGQDGHREDLWLDRLIPKSELSKLACEDDKNYCSYDTKLPTSATSGETAGAIMGVNENYAWSTGPYRWTKFGGLKKADGTVVSIDQPLDLFYNVPDESVYGASKGRRVALQYPGNGKLWMPGRCENVGSGEPSRDCSGATEIYINDFIIPYDSEKGVVQDVQGNRYLVKWTRKGIYYPNHSDPNACSASNVVAKFDTGDALQLPSASVWVNPRESIGSTIPADADPTKPRYVDGVKVN